MIRRATWPALAIPVLFLAGCGTKNLPADLLEGTWQVTAVEREGKGETAEVGAQLVFDGNEVRLGMFPIEILPRARIVDAAHS
jgi:hypothetical protein